MWGGRSSSHSVHSKQDREQGLGSSLVELTPPDADVLLPLPPGSPPGPGPGLLPAGVRHAPETHSVLCSREGPPRSSGPQETSYADHMSPHFPTRSPELFEQPLDSVKSSLAGRDDRTAITLSISATESKPPLRSVKTLKPCSFPPFSSRTPLCVICP